MRRDLTGVRRRRNFTGDIDCEGKEQEEEGKRKSGEGELEEKEEGVGRRMGRTDRKKWDELIENARVRRLMRKKTRVDKEE